MSPSESDFLGSGLLASLREEIIVSGADQDVRSPHRAGVFQELARILKEAQLLGFSF